MLTHIPVNRSKKFIGNYFNCTWVNENNYNYINNIDKLIILQRWFKKIIFSKRLTKIIPLLMPLYYHPSSKGGYLHKKQLLEFVDSMT